MTLSFKSHSPRSKSQKKPTGLVGRLIGALFFFVFFAMGSFFAYMLGAEMVKNFQVLSWPQAQCAIIKSEVVQESSESYKVNFRYQYDWDGHTFQNTKYTLSESESSFSTYSEAQSVKNKFSEGTVTTCYINSENPSESVLTTRSWWFGLVILFPGIFILVGLGGMYACLFSKNDSSRTRNKEKSSRQKGGSLGARIFGAVFFLIGLGIAYPLIYQPVSGVLKARSWNATECTVISSKVKSHSSDDGTTYSIYVFYSYLVDGKLYKSDRYNFLSGSSSGYDSKKAVVDRLSPGTKFTCFYDPNNPFEAVIERGFSLWLLLGLIPLVFCAVGLLVFFLGGASTKPLSNRSGAISGLNSAASYADGPVILKPTATTLQGFIILLFICLIWNGAISAFGFELFGKWQRGRLDWTEGLFFSPFAIIGFFILIGTIRQFLALFNPKIELELSNGNVRLGERVTLRWRMHGNTSKVTRIKIDLEGKEQATYRVGTNTNTVSRNFFEKVLTETTHRLEIASGQKVIEIPKELMHSFDAQNNKIIWTLKVSGEIPRWPDLSMEFPLVVLPMKKISEE